MGVQFVLKRPQDAIIYQTLPNGCHFLFSQHPDVVWKKTSHGPWNLRDNYIGSTEAAIHAPCNLLHLGKMESVRHESRKLSVIAFGQLFSKERHDWHYFMCMGMQDGKMIVRSYDTGNLVDIPVDTIVYPVSIVYHAEIM